MDWPTVIVAAPMIALAIAAWGRVALRVRSGEPVVPFEPRREAPWRFGDLLMIAMFYLLASVAFYSIFLFMASLAGDEAQALRTNEEKMTAGGLAVTVATTMAANLAATGFALLWIFSHTDATWRDFGWRRDTLGSDVRLGLWAFAAIAAPIYGLQLILAPLADKQHPIIEVLAHEGTPLLYILTGFSAVAVAPLAEEFFFRVLLQGWIEAISTRPASAGRETAEPWITHAGSPAIVATSLLFALMHLGHGYDPIPLFFLALVLGYLYRRTHRLVPSVTVHVCLNGFSYLILCCGGATG